MAANTPTSPPPADTQLRYRVSSIDVLRGWNVVLMLFVNNLASVHGLPEWLAHDESADGMTFVDVVFPAFCFIVGMALPLAMGGEDSSKTRASQLLPIWHRAIGLAALGVLMVNAAESYDTSRALVSKAAWELLVYVGAGCIWLRGPLLDSWARPGLRRAIGLTAWLVAALSFRGIGQEQRWLELQLHWWGILGLIGWAYLIAGHVYVFIRPRPGSLALAAIALWSWHILEHPASEIPVLSSWRMGGGHSTMAALVLAGAALVQWCRPALASGASVTTGPTHLLVRRALVFGCCCFAAGLVLHRAIPDHPAFLYSKNHATPPWALLSAAYTSWAWALVIATSQRTPARFEGFVRAVGQAALIAFLLEPLLANALAGCGRFDPGTLLGRRLDTGIFRAAAFAGLAAWATAKIRAAGLRFRL